MANVVLPKVRLFVPCMSLDIGPGKPVTIHSPLHTIRMPPGISEKYVVDAIWFYVVLTDGVGAFRLSVEMRNDEDVVLQKGKPALHQFRGGGQLEAHEVPVSMSPVPFPRPGMYEFRLLANHVH